MPKVSIPPSNQVLIPQMNSGHARGIHISLPVEVIEFVIVAN